MAEPSLTATAGGTALLAPLLAQWDTSLEMLLARLSGLTDAEYRWHPTPGAADLVDDGLGGVVVSMERGSPTRTIAWTLGHLVDMCLTRADYTDGAHDAPLPYQPFTASATEAVAQFQTAAARWRSAVAGASAEQALQVGYSAWPIGMDRDLPFVDVVWWMNRELIAHGSDMATVRDLYGARA
jgi:DinB family protein